MAAGMVEGDRPTVGWLHRAWLACRPSLVPVICVDAGAVVVLAILIAAADRSVPDLWVCAGAVVAGGLLAPVHVVLIRMGNVAEGAVSNLVLALSPALSLGWLAAFTTLRLGRPWWFAWGAGLIVVGSAAAQWRAQASEPTRRRSAADTADTHSR